MDLLPCPFCGSDDAPRVIDLGGGYHINCSYCGVVTGCEKSKMEAIEAWNRRTQNCSNSDTQPAGFIDMVPMIKTEISDEVCCPTCGQPL